MCGITGAAWTGGVAPLELGVLERMTTAIAHRGPDDAGYYHSRWAPAGSGRDLSAAQRNASSATGSSPGAALGHRRLSIIDLAGGHQPLSNEDGTIWIAFNGEIYNYRELQPVLERQGHRFHTSSDTETIVHLYEQHGVECVKFLRGMFAFALWDEPRRQMFLARDRVGKKPLVYRLERDRLLFASELKALLEVPGIPRALNPVAVNEYLTYQYVPHPHSILQGFHKLPPAHWALYRDGKLETRRYWVPAFEPAPGTVPGTGTTPMTEAQGRQKLRETLTEAVRLRMRSDVPLGAFLSGGIDSTITAGLMQQLSDRPVKTFSIGFPVKEFDERSYARMAAQHLGTEHHEQVVEPSALQILPKLIRQYDEPFADSSAIPTMYLAEMARQHVTVALSGDGGDELFAGYGRYRGIQRALQLAPYRRCLLGALSASPWRNGVAALLQKSRRRRIRGLLSDLAAPLERRYLGLVCFFDDERLPHDRIPPVCVLEPVRRRRHAEELRADLGPQVIR
jgi:asparagine synthase (glutamine-hydrolysing)